MHDGFIKSPYAALRFILVIAAYASRYRLIPQDSPCLRKCVQDFRDFYEFIMHELSLIRSLLDIVEDYAAKHRFHRVHSLKLSFGRLSCLDAQALKFAFDVQSAGTKAEGRSWSLTFVLPG